MLLIMSEFNLLEGVEGKIPPPQLSSFLRLPKIANELLIQEPRYQDAQININLVLPAWLIPDRNIGLQYTNFFPLIHFKFVIIIILMTSFFLKMP